MSRELLKRCIACSEYTLKEPCPYCDEPARSPRPPKYSPEDRYGEYRRRLKRLEAE